MAKYEKEKDQWFVYEFKWVGETGYDSQGQFSIKYSLVQIIEMCETADLAQATERTRLKKTGFSDEEIDTYCKSKEKIWHGSPLRIAEGYYPSSHYKLGPRTKFFDDPNSHDYIKLVDVTTHTNWNRFFLVMAISFSSVWFLYLFVRLVIIGFILEGFKNKSSKRGETD